MSSRNHHSQRIFDSKNLKKDNEIYNIKFQNTFVLECSKQTITFELEKFFGIKSNKGIQQIKDHKNQSERLVNEMTVKQRIEFQVYYYLYQLR